MLILGIHPIPYMVRKNRFGIIRRQIFESSSDLDEISLSSYSKTIRTWQVAAMCSRAAYEQLTDIVYDRADVKNQQDMCNIIDAYLSRFRQE